MNKRHWILALILVMIAIVAGCSDSAKSRAETAAADSATASTPPTETPELSQGAGELSVRFGEEGEIFALHLYENSTAETIAQIVGATDWQLPIYHYDDFENSEVMQYYDIPSRYEIPSSPENVTEEQAGTVYYSEPNRIILFYQDAQIPGEYTPVGHFDDPEKLAEAVEDNPVLEGWGNKLIFVSNA